MRELQLTKHRDKTKPSGSKFDIFLAELLNLQYVIKDKQSSPVDLTGLTFKFTVKPDGEFLTNDVLILEDSGGTGEDLANGIVAFDIDANTTTLQAYIAENRARNAMAELTSSDGGIYFQDDIVCRPNIYRGEDDPAYNPVLVTTMMQLQTLQ